MGRVILAAVSSGSGKTTITCGLLSGLKGLGYSANAYKCGPDYIDPMFHKRVLGIPSENLDPFFCDGAELRKLIAGGEQYDISVIEGVMGIYDGFDPKSPKGSAYDIACMTETPIVLIVDAKGMGRTLISVIKGILADDAENRIKGIILNRISKGYYETIGPAVESETLRPVIGYFPVQQALGFDSRHLGLKLPSEISDIQEKLALLGKEISKTIDIEQLIKISKEAVCIGSGCRERITEVRPVVSLAVAMDAAFCFYYEENMRLMQQAGVNIVPFSPLEDERLPDGVDGLWLGGGYPELYLKELMKNETMRQSIRSSIADGLPSIAECGGFMYLHDYIESDEGEKYSMVGSVSGGCHNTGKLCRFGYVKLLIGDYTVKGHEFHYYDSDNCGLDGVAIKASNGSRWKYGHMGNNHIWGYPHMYLGSCKELVNEFVLEMKKYKESKNE